MGLITKKNYIAPKIEIIEMENEGVIAASDAGGSGSDLPWGQNLDSNNSIQKDLLAEIFDTTDLG